MKKVLSLILALSMLSSVLIALPAVTVQAAETTLSASLSYTYGSARNSSVTMHGYTTRPYALSWVSSSDGYRTGYIAFPFGDVDLTGKFVSKATLNLTISKTQNMNESTSGVNIYAVDYSKVDGTLAPTSDILLASYKAPSAVHNQGDYTYPVSIDIDLTEYLETYPNAEGVGIMFSNRDDQLALKGMIGFCGYDEGTNAPTLTIEYGAEASVNVVLSSADGKISEEKGFKGLYAEDIFKITEEIAPSAFVVDNKYYVRRQLKPVTLTPGVNTVNVVYKSVTIESADTSFTSDDVIKGGIAALPAHLDAVTTEGETVTVPVKWTKLSEDEYEADLIDITVTKKVNIVSCDSVLTSFKSSGNSDNASFSTYNDIKLSVGGGTAIFDTAFRADGGTNMLIMYGNSSTTSFGNTAALLRMFANKNADDNYVFEYYNGSWKSSDIVCEYGTEYVVRTAVDMSNKTYSLFISENGSSFIPVNPTPSPFRGSSISYIDRMYLSGSVTVTGFRAHWADGYSTITVSPVDEEGNLIAEEYTLKCTTGSVYVANNLPALFESEGELFIMEDVSYTPSIKVTEAATLDVRYNKAGDFTYDDIHTVLVQGDSTINLPGTVSLTFSDSQVVPASVKWDTSVVKKDIVGEYTVTGTIEGLTETTLSATVKVRGVTNLPKTTENTVVTNNGGWNWYVEPSGTHIQPGDDLATLYESGTYSSNNGYQFTEDKTYMGWVEDGGDIVISSLDHNTGEHKRVVIHEKLESDDHNNPAVIVLPDGRIMAVYTMHTNEPYLYYRVSKYPEDISEWNDEQLYFCKCKEISNDTGTYNPTYPSVFVVHDDCGIIGNDVIYMGWRGVHWKPTLAKFGMPDKNGVCEIVMGQTQFANTTYDGGAKSNGGKSDGGRRPYSKYDYDIERNKLYITFTATHPDNEARNHIYYVELDIADQNLYTASGNLLQPLPFENNTEYIGQGANSTNGQWGVVTADLVGAFPELVVFDASENTGRSFSDVYGGIEHRGWTWDIMHNEKGEPCIVYADITATPPGENGALPETYAEPGDEATDPEHATRAHHYYWYARWDKETGEWVKTFLTYGGKWWHQNYKQERCYSGGLTFDHNYPGNVIYLAIPIYGKYGNIFEIYRWKSEDNGATWTEREALTENSPTPNARPNAIYNYKTNPDGTHAGPRLLWKSGEYRYWLNYEYKTGVWTDYATEGFVAQDDPEMFADAVLLGEDGEVLTKLPVGEDVTVTAKFTVSNLSIGDGQAKLALAHYSKDNIFKKFTATDSTIPARSVPQIGVIGAPKMTDDGSHSPWAKPDNRSTMGESEVVETIDYTATIEEGDRIALFAWGVGIEHPWHPLSSINYSVSTEGEKLLFSENFSYDGTELLTLNKDTLTFNGWTGNGFTNVGETAFNDISYAAITKAPFGNTALHLYRNGGNGVMVSHALPDTNGEDYTIEFTARYITELAWNRTDNIGFSLSHGVPSYKGDTEALCAYQLRHNGSGGNENGRGTRFFLKDSLSFDTGNSKTIVNTGVPRDVDVSGMEQADYSKGVGYFDPEAGTYIHDYHDSLMTGALFYVTLKVSPSNKTVEFSVCDGYRTATHTADFNGKSSCNWDENPIDTITFSAGTENVGEVYIDDIKMYLTRN